MSVEGGQKSGHGGNGVGTATGNLTVPLVAAELDDQAQPACRVEAERRIPSAQRAAGADLERIDHGLRVAAVEIHSGHFFFLLRQTA